VTDFHLTVTHRHVTVFQLQLGQPNLPKHLQGNFFFGLLEQVTSVTKLKMGNAPSPTNEWEYDLRSGNFGGCWSSFFTGWMSLLTLNQQWQCIDNKVNIVPYLIWVLLSELILVSEQSLFINPVLGCHYFLTGPQLPSQPQSITLASIKLYCFVTKACV